MPVTWKKSPRFKPVVVLDRKIQRTTTLTVGRDFSSFLFNLGVLCVSCMLV